MRIYKCDEGISCYARDIKSAKNKLEGKWRAAVTNVRVDGDAEEYAALPDCSCGWRGHGTGPNGRFVKGDRCPDCGELFA